MKLMGNIFTVLILLMSVVFLIVSVMVGASDRAWKDEAQELRQRAAQAEQRLQEVKGSTLNQQKLLESERAARALQLGNLQTQLKTRQDQLTLVTNQLQKAVEVSQAQLAELEQAQTRIKGQDKQLEDLKSANKQLVDDIATQFQKVRNLTNQVYEANNAITALTTTKNKMASRVAKLEKVVVNNGLSINQLTDHIPQPVEAVVDTVQGDGLFTILIGQDDGIRIGHKVDVYRRNRYVGKARVVQAKNNLAVLRTIEGLMNDQVRKGDNVSTKL